MPTQTVSEKRKVARIVFDRPPLKKLNFLLWTLAGLVLGILVALLLHLFFGIGAPVAGEIPAPYLPNYWHDLAGHQSHSPSNECSLYYFVLGLIGLVAGICLGFGWKRQVTARIEMVEQPTMTRRRSSSTALVRVDYGRRW